eukprot:TRINITY_DN2544_c0_g1_i1.p1 TRINITY_DN2544_c0_g1~~TRINITY_DN2544_c0_g1_i1.p1  ORF type:complete len:325 (-),score=120.80 TRINITY_DN2544_c0_g1_i1:203-1177(-)
MFKIILAIAVLFVVTISCFSENESCGTQIHWEQKIQAQRGLQSFRSADGTCAYEYDECDDPEKRANTDVLTNYYIGVRIQILMEGPGIYPGDMTEKDVYDQIDQLNHDLNTYGIYFTVISITEHQPNVGGVNFKCLAKYGLFTGWQNDLNTFKTVSAEEPENYLNIFITCQDPGTSGTLLGIGTFPWDKDALTALGGLWINSAYVGKGHKTATHEVGHNLGLWHTFHGVSEVPCGDDCYEIPHNTISVAYDKVGDFCADTPAAPREYVCRNPTVTDQCSSTPFGDVDYSNFMSYAPDDCMNQLTTCQKLRSRCYIKNKLGAWLQ